ncbi:MAG: calcium-binding protein [Nocardioides sp.]|uniref:calcium-binding protein n=1 Tax=Nocardioides sp. TaxID=35761 RepID=UPI0039E2815A
MFRRQIHALALTAVAATTAAGLALIATPAANADSHKDGSLPPTELMGDGPTPIPLKHMARLTVSDWGYRYTAGQQNSKLTITEVDGGLLYVDTGTERWRKVDDKPEIPKTCEVRSVSKGISAWCSIPYQWSGDETMFLEVWTRLGNDTVDGSTLSAKYRMWVLADWGNDTVYTGDGDDFVNGARGRDRVDTGAGDDWARGGKGRDVVDGGPGDDRLLGQQLKDALHGGDGDDKVYGGPGPDSLWADGGKDRLVCGTGPDNAWVDDDDSSPQCESVTHTKFTTGRVSHRG